MANYNGTKNNDVYHGGDDDDLIRGGAGHDRLHGGRGNDEVHGDAGSDWLYGEDGNDKLFGGVGEDRLYGGIGNDDLDGGIGEDLLYGGDGRDRLTGGVGEDWLDGGVGTDTAIYSGVLSNYVISTADGVTTIRDLRSRRDGGDGTDRLVGVERIKFGDGTILFLTPNQAPIAGDDGFSVAEDGTASGNLLTNDSDPDEDPISVSGVNGSSAAVGNQITLTSGALLTVNADGSYAYDANGAFEGLDDGETGSDSFQYTISDGFGGTATATVTITVNGSNDAPESGGDTSASGGEDDVSIGGNVPAATDVDDEPLTYALVSGSVLVDGEAAADGTVTVNSDGSYSYTPNDQGLDDGESRIITFQYVANDGTADSNAATVTITVNGSNDAPESGGDTSASGGEDDVSIGGNVPAASDVDDEPLTYALVAGSVLVDGEAAADGTVTVNSDGSYSYTPNDQGLDDAESRIITFQYVANDGTADSDPATVTITVHGSNDAPESSGDSYSTDEDTTLNIAAAGVLANDSDADGDALTAALVSDVSHGTLTLNADGSFSYTPDADYHGADSFTYRANDGTADGNVVTVELTVTSVNDAPVARNITLPAGGGTGALVIGGFYTGEAGMVIYGLSDNNGDGNPETVNSSEPLAAVADFSYGMATGDIDGDGDNDIVIIRDGRIDSLTNVGDLDGDGLDEFTLSTVRPGSFGHDIALGDLNGDGLLDLVTSNANLLFEFINQGDSDSDGLADNFDQQNHVDSYLNDSTYGIATTDMNGDGRTDIVKVGYDEGPTEIWLNRGDTNGDGQIDYTLQVIEDAFDEQGTGVDVGDVDGDGDQDFIVSRWSGSSEVIYLNAGDPNGDGLLEFITVQLFTGFSTLESELFDIDGDSDLDVISSHYQGHVSIAYNRGDTNGDGIVNFVLQSVASGTIEIFGLAMGDVDGDGRADVYLPSISSSQRYLRNLGDTNSDGELEFVAVQVAGAPQSWDAEFMPGSSPILEDGPAVTAAFDGDDVDSDDDAASLTYAITSTPGEGSVVNNGDGTFSFDPEADFQDLGEGETRDVSFTYTATDSHGAVSNAATVTVTVTGVNDGPSAPADTNAAANQVSENAAVGSAVGITASSTDADGDALSYYFRDGSGNVVQTLGKFAVNATTGVVTLAAEVDYETATSHNFTIYASDGTAESSSNFTVNVTDYGAVMDFEGLSGVSHLAFYSSNYFEDGFVADPINHFHVFQGAGGDTSIRIYDFSGEGIQLRMGDGSAFDLERLDIEESYGTVVYTGSNGATLTYTGGAYDNYDFGGLFDNVTWVSITMPNSSSGHRIDDVLWG